MHDKLQALYTHWRDNEEPVAAAILEALLTYINQRNEDGCPVQIEGGGTGSGDGGPGGGP